MPLGTTLEIPAGYPDNATTRAIFAPVELAPFRLTEAQAAELAALTPTMRELTLSDLYGAYLIERIPNRFLRHSPVVGREIARSWDKRGAEYMEAARAEYRRALAAGREAA
ncbi:MULTISPECIES: hypothetical protein [unclassified Novosphingobium]|uniref:hypothetical protein n=1 Tax=unclassified Novosphingobium TaxID=2644732 RepID=UPI000D3087E2|nr:MULTISPECIES: hypothetical protein [unclassified Novosphingobium]PTR06402.1 hypothetical protein C8K11_12015 [Novosphingobium sp. GV055]PUA94821.1 hypothetical protein C8K12_12015 [Novosphingobium sp. GV061]PUB13746.1 hypothetical protein C8K14_12015 [Novosphingobium sp. GV079]PUB38444.1 hypothetical protein C8K10_12015 [Novosphingobium sp. GV027]